MSINSEDDQFLEALKTVWETKDKVSEIYLKYHNKKIPYNLAITELEVLATKAEAAKRTIVFQAADLQSSGLVTTILMYYLEIKDNINEINEVIHDINELAYRRGDWDIDNKES